MGLVEDEEIEVRYCIPYEDGFLNLIRESYGNYQIRMSDDEKGHFFFSFDKFFELCEEDAISLAAEEKVLQFLGDEFPELKLKLAKEIRSLIRSRYLAAVKNKEGG